MVGPARSLWRCRHVVRRGRNVRQPMGCLVPMGAVVRQPGGCPTWPRPTVSRRRSSCARPERASGARSPTPEEFGTWFRVKLDGAFAEGATVRGRITYPGYEHVTMEMQVERMDPERLFSYRWHPYAIEPRRRLLGGADDARRVPARGGRRGHAAHHRRVGLRPTPERAPRRGVPHERAAAGPSSSATSSAMSRRPSAAAARLAGAAPVFAALGDETRLRLVARLCAEGPLSIVRLSAGVPVTRQADHEASPCARGGGPRARQARRTAAPAHLGAGAAAARRRRGDTSTASRSSGTMRSSG